MRYKLLGKSGLRVSELALGTMTFGEEWGWGASREESRKIFDAYTNAGGNFINTANRYTEGTSEKYVGEFISADRDHFVLATKYSLFTRENDPNFSGNHRKNMMQALHASLKRLNTDYVDLYWVHAWDFLTPVEEVLRGLDDMVRAGKILYIGISDTPAWVVSRANTLAELMGWSSFAALQIQYSLVERTVERELLPMARYLYLAVTPWGVLGAGVLSGKYNLNKDAKGRANLRSEVGKDKLRIAQEVIKVAGKYDKTPSQVALNWVREQPGVIIPILGAKTVDQLQDNLGFLDFPLDRKDLERLERVSHIEPGFPTNFLQANYTRKLLYGGTFDQIDKHGSIL